MPKELRSWLMLALLACIWGSSFILMKRGMETTTGEAIYSDTQVASLRMLIAGLTMLPFGLWSLRRIKKPKQFLSLIVVGFSGNFFPAFLFTFAETELSSGLAGMLNSFTPFFTLMIGWLFFRQSLKWKQSIGLLLAFCGIVLLILMGSQLENHGTWVHIAALVLATFFYGLSLNTIKHTLADFKAWEITSLAFTFVAIPAGCCAFFTGTFSTIQTNPHAMEGLGYIAILSIFGTCLALVIFNRIIALTSAVFASSVTYFIPFVAVAMGTLLNHESFHWLQLVAMLVVLSGVYLASKAK
jgi:drug/metabolite transporter (DMT)-like permease